MQQNFYKRNYHPLIPLFFTKGIFNEAQLKDVPKRTLQSWSKNKNKVYDMGYLVHPFINQIENLQKIHKRTERRKMIEFALTLSKGYGQILKRIPKKKKLLKENANFIVEAIDNILELSNIKLKRICKFYGVSSDWYYREKRKVNCSFHIFNTCFKQRTNQLTFNEISAIEKIIKSPEHHGKPLTTLYYYALRKELVFCGKSTFSKYAKAFGFKKIKKPKIPPRKGVKTSRVFEFLHVDITLVPTLESGMQKVAFVKDNFSKAILHWGSVSEKANSEFITKLFKETFEKYNLYNKKAPINILTDGGSENKGEFTRWVNDLKTPPLVSKITARTVDFPLSNNMSESIHRIYKTEFLKGQVSKDRKEHFKSLIAFVHYYNHIRYFGDLYGLSAMEVVNGKIPEKDYFRLQIAEAKKNRTTINKAFNRCNSLK